MTQHVIVRRGDKAVRGTVVGPLLAGETVPGARQHHVRGATVVRVDRADWPMMPTASEEWAGVYLGERGNQGGAEFRDLIVYGTVEARYSVQMTDSETPAVWMSLPGVLAVRPGAQDSGRVHYTVETTDAPALEAALEADDSVLEYEAR